MRTEENTVCRPAGRDPARGCDGAFPMLRMLRESVVFAAESCEMVGCESPFVDTFAERIYN